MSTPPSPPQTLTGALRSRWSRLTGRERGAVALAVVCVTGWLWLAGLIQPAWQRWQAAPQRIATLQADARQMQTLAAQAQALKAQSPLPREVRLAALQSATRQHLGAAASVTPQVDQVVIQVPGVGPHALAQWLADVRSNARLTPSSIQLDAVTGGGPRPGTDGQASPEPAWRGTVRFNLGG